MKPRTYNPLEEIFHHPTTADKDKVSVECDVLKETERAIAIVPKFLDGYENLEGDAVWIPLSQVDEIHLDRVVLRRWIAEKKGLI